MGGEFLTHGPCRGAGRGPRPVRDAGPGRPIPPVRGPTAETAPKAATARPSPAFHPTMTAALTEVLELATAGDDVVDAAAALAVAEAALTRAEVRL